jgi:predicted dehydrogenase
MADRIRIGMIGCGQIAQVHLKGYSDIPDVEIVACADLNDQAARRAAERWGIPNVYTDYAQLLKRDDLDAVDVCLHNNLHRPATVAALESGKHVYCEKPMAGTYRDALAMLDASRRYDKKLHIQLATLYKNETRAAKELIEAGELGDLYHARSYGHRRRGRPYVDGYGSPGFVQKKQAAGGALYDMGVYKIAQVLYLLGNPEVDRIVGRTYQKVAMNEDRRKLSGYDVEELGLGFVVFKDGSSLDIIESWAVHLDAFGGSVVVGSKGGIRLEPFGLFRALGNFDINATIDLGGARFRWDNLSETGRYYTSSQAHWIGALQGKVPLLPTAEVALTTMLVSEGIYVSQQLGREVRAEEVAALDMTN